MLAPVILCAVGLTQTASVPPEDPSPRRGRRASGYETELGLVPLELQRVPHGDLEFRVWAGFAWGIQAIRLVRTKGEWRGQRLEFTPDGKRIFLAPMAPPAGGWNRVWTRLKALGVLTIPDEAFLPDDGVEIADGWAYIFQFRTGTHFHSYYYDNPQNHPAKAPARQVTRMLEFLQGVTPPRSLVVQSSPTPRPGPA